MLLGTVLFFFFFWSTVLFFFEIQFFYSINFNFLTLFVNIIIIEIIKLKKLIVLA